MLKTEKKRRTCPFTEENKNEKITKFTDKNQITKKQQTYNFN